MPNHGKWTTTMTDDKAVEAAAKALDGCAPRRTAEVLAEKAVNAARPVIEAALQHELDEEREELELLKEQNKLLRSALRDYSEDLRKVNDDG